MYIFHLLFKRIFSSKITAAILHEAVLYIHLLHVTDILLLPNVHSVR